jgi:NAD dependent epimerase/dehydratase family enzyme
MRRPSWTPVPGFVLTLKYGELAEIALLRGQQAFPSRAQELGFSFRYGEIRPAMAAIFGRR